MDDGKVWDIVRKVVRKIIRKMTFSLRNKDTTFAKQNDRWKKEEQKSDKNEDRKIDFFFEEKLNYMDSIYMETNYTEKWNKIFVRTKWLFLGKENRDLEIRILELLEKMLEKFCFCT